MSIKPRWIDSGDNWGTPDWFKQQLIDNKHLAKKHFDPCPLNNDIEKYNGLIGDWEQDNFINPPYSKAPIKKQWVLKVIEQYEKGLNCTLLLPTSTSTNLFHGELNPYLKDLENFQYGKDWFFVNKRIPFIGINNKKQCVNFPIEQRSPFWKTAKVEHLGRILPKYIKGAGMHDSFIIKFIHK